MACLGIRCSNNDYTYVIIAGDLKSPKIEEKDAVQFPKGYTRSQSLKWFLQELEGIFARHNIKVVAIKGTEGTAARGIPFRAF